MSIAPTPRRLVLLFDGTWNRREHTTNVWRLRLMLDHSDDQIIYYDQGVGTDQFEKVRGGALGTGLSRKVLSGYLWLMENYRSAAQSPTEVADDVYVFGFSRGAFTARSLVGFLSLCGLIHNDAAVSVLRAFELSREDTMSRMHPIMQDFRRQFSVDVPIKFLGVWDTVGALGVAKLDIPFLERYRFHKAEELHQIVEHARHAMALDEHRKIFCATLWPKITRAGQTLEQRWFTGAHANVGGGYEQDGLFLRPLQWMMDQARLQNLGFRTTISSLSDAFYRSLPINSLEEIGLGAYYLTQRFKRFDRVVTFSDPTEQTLDYTVLQRWLWQRSYDPPSLRDALGSRPRYQGPSIRLSIPDILSHIPSVRLSPNSAHVAGFVVP